MPTYQVRAIIDGQPTFDKPLTTILGGLKQGGGIKTLTPLEYLTEQQRAWWKGILLPELSNRTGDSIDWWETRLKLAVMPDEFAPSYVAVGTKVMAYVPSITILGKKKMRWLIDGAVKHLHNEEIYGDTFLDITEPDKELRRK